MALEKKTLDLFFIIKTRTRTLDLEENTRSSVKTLNWSPWSLIEKDKERARKSKYKIGVRGVTVTSWTPIGDRRVTMTPRTPIGDHVDTSKQKIIEM